jgi:hypothetical protein
VNVYPFIEAEKVQRRNVTRACQLLEVPPVRLLRPARARRRRLRRRPPSTTTDPTQGSVRPTHRPCPSNRVSSSSARMRLGSSSAYGGVDAALAAR